jgi:hypothetical protein
MRAALGREIGLGAGMIPEKWVPVFHQDRANQGMIPEKWAPVFRQDHAN